MITTSQLARRFDISAIKLNKILKENNILRLRGRPSKKVIGEYRKYWHINDEYIKYGFNEVNFKGGSSPKWYISNIKEFEKLINKLI